MSRDKQSTHFVKMSQYSFLCDNFCCDTLQVFYEMTCIIKTWQETYSTNMTLRCQNSWGIKIGVWQNNYNASTFIYDILEQTKIFQQISRYKKLRNVFFLLFKRLNFFVVSIYANYNNQIIFEDFWENHNHVRKKKSKIDLLEDA